MSETKVNNGARLVQLLKESGTGKGKLDLIRKRLALVHEAECRVMTSKEVVAYMKTDSSFSQDTIDKAELIMETGSWEMTGTGGPNDPGCVEDELAGQSGGYTDAGTLREGKQPPPADLEKMKKRFGDGENISVDMSKELHAEGPHGSVEAGKHVTATKTHDEHGKPLPEPKKDDKGKDSGGFDVHKRR